MSTASITAVFEERAENLSPEELEGWSTDTPHDRRLLKELSGPGAKLLSGPRGCGKSTLLRRTYFHLLGSKKALPVYANFSRSLALEPLFHRNADAHRLFRQWILAKIVLGANEAFRDAQIKLPEDLQELAPACGVLVDALSAGRSADDLAPSLAPSQLLARLDSWSEAFSSRRTVLLLDDAAHAFTHDQQADFFEVFRELRSRTVAGKAAVYPGVTSYSPHFHVGHEAATLDAWLSPSEPGFLQNMWQVILRRLPANLRTRVEDHPDIVHLLSLASFGIPRGLILMLSQVLDVDDATSRPTPMTRKRAMDAISGHAESVRAIHEAISKKLPRFRNLVFAGADLEQRAAALLRTFNREKSLGKKAVTIAFKTPIDQQLESALGLLEYAGILRRSGTVSRGVKGVFQRFELHYSLVISGNALSLGRAFSIEDVNVALLTRSAHAFVRTSGPSLLGDNYQDRCRLDLAPCSACGTPRSSPDARYCVSCGAALLASSVYESLLDSPVEALPLTSKKIQGLKNAGLGKVQDVLLDTETKRIRKIPYVGEVWAARIRNAADEFVSL